MWSATYHPTRKEPDSYAVLFNEDRAEFSRRDGDLTTTLDVVVSAEDDSEARRIAISNSGRTPRVIEITSYVELSLATQLADVAHPAFSKLFVETERLASSGALLAQRRKRGPDDVDVFAAHLMVVEGKTVGISSSRPIGRNFSVADGPPGPRAQWKAARSVDRRARCSIRSSRCGRASSWHPARRRT